MKDARTARMAGFGIGAGLLGLVLATACAPKAARRQTDVMEKIGTVSVSALQLRARVDGLADRISGRLEGTADLIRAQTQDRVVRRRALTLEVDAIPAVYSAAYHADPLTSVLDVWALAFQMTQYVDDGAGRDAFGAQQPLARQAARDVLADTEAVIRSFTPRSEDFDRARGRVEGWATDHPIEQTFASRASLVTYMAGLRSDERSAFLAVGDVSVGIENISERLNTYAAQLPKQARWQAEILVADMAGERGVEGTLSDVHAIGAAAQRANEVLDEAGPAVSKIVAAERRAVLEGVNGQRLQTLEYMTGERVAVLAALREERMAVVDVLRQERVEALKEVDAIKTRAVETSVDGLRGLIDYALWRVTALLVFLMAAAATLVVLGYWLTVGRRSPVAS